MLIQLSFNLLNLYKITGFLPLIIFLFCYIKWKKVDKSIINFLPFIVLIFFATLVETVVRYFYKYEDLKWYRLYDFLEFYSILVFYYFELKAKKKLYAFFAICYLVLFFYLSLSWTNKSIGDQPLIIATAVLVIISTVLWFVNVFKNFEPIPLHRRSGFYLVSILLIYILGTTLSFLSVDFIFKNDFDNLKILTSIIHGFNIISRVLIVVTLLKFLKFSTE